MAEPINPAETETKLNPSQATPMMSSSEKEPSMEKEDNQVVSWPYMTFGTLIKSFFTKAMTVGLIWGVGYLNWNFAWLIPPIAFVVLRGERKKDAQMKRLTAQATALSKDKIIIENRIDELPVWVYFPDYDRAEWLNGVLYKAWPSVNQYARDLVKTQIQEAIAQSVAEYQKKIPGLGKDFRFDRVVLGRIPPKINGVKVYDKHTSRNEIILDMDIMYAGDCDIAFTMGTIRGGIKDFQLRGMLRVVLKPLIPVIPIVGGVQAFFLNCPILDFNLVGIADVLDFPGFNDVMRKIVAENVAAIAVLPNKITIKLSEDIPTEVLKTPEPEGVLRIHVVQAKHLMKKDIGMLGKGKSDPYAVITVGAQEFRTQTIDNTVDPKWDYWCECVVTSAIAQQLTIQVWDFDDTKNDEILGRATIEVSQVKKKGVLDKWLTLELVKHGMVQLRLSWLGLSSSKADLAAALKETQELRVTAMSTAILILYVDSAKNLPCLKGSKQPDVYLEARVNGKTERTATQARSCNPVWEQGFILLVTNPETGTLHIQINDDKSGSVVGALTYNISALLTMDNMQMKLQPFDLQKSGPDSKLTLSMNLRILKNGLPEVTSEDESEEDEDIQSLNKKIERQESTVSSILPDSPLRRQPSKESVQSLISNATSAALEDAMSTKDNIEDAIRAEYSSGVSAINRVSSIRSDSPGLIRRNPSVMSFAGEAKLGRIQLTLKYSIARQKLMIVIHKIANLPLPANDPSNIPDPYVKIYLLPDRHKDTKRKTAVKKDNCNPVFDEQFEYIVSQGDINSRVLELSICTQKGWLSSGTKCMGQVLINLSELDFTQATTSWYDLQPESKD